MQGVTPEVTPGPPAPLLALPTGPRSLAAPRCAPGLEAGNEGDELGCPAGTASEIWSPPPRHGRSSGAPCWPPVPPYILSWGPEPGPGTAHTCLPLSHPQPFFQFRGLSRGSTIAPTPPRGHPRTHPLTVSAPPQVLQPEMVLYPQDDKKAGEDGKLLKEVCFFPCGSPEPVTINLGFPSVLLGAPVSCQPLRRWLPVPEPPVFPGVTYEITSLVASTDQVVLLCRTRLEHASETSSSACIPLACWSSLCTLQNLHPHTHHHPSLGSPCLPRGHPARSGLFEIYWSLALPTSPPSLRTLLSPLLLFLMH